MVFVDLIVIILFLSFVNILERSQKKYVENFKNDTIDMTDFTIRVKPMPYEGKYGDNDVTLRAFLMTHFEGIIKDEFNATQAYRHQLNSQYEIKDFDTQYVTKNT